MNDGQAHLQKHPQAKQLLEHRTCALYLSAVLPTCTQFTSYGGSNGVVSPHAAVMRTGVRGKQEEVRTSVQRLQPVEICK